MIKIFLASIVILLCSSCHQEGYRHEKDFRLEVKKNILSSEPSIILTNVDTKSQYWNEKVFDRSYTRMDWCRLENNKCADVVNFSPYTKIKFKSLEGVGDYQFYTAKSGFYYLDYTKQKTGYLENWHLLPIFIPAAILSAGGVFVKELNFNTSISGWNKKQNAANYASFETNPGEIVYIGDLDFTFTKQKYWLKGKINLEVSDNYNDAVAYFRAKHPEYKDKPVIKRLAKTGILLDNYDAGFFW